MFLAVAAALVLGAACAPKPRLAINPEFSWNIVEVPEEWPGEKPEKVLTAAEISALEEYGRPDAIRIVYDRARRIVSRMEVDTYFTGKNPKKLEDFERSWLYIQPKIELVFHPSGRTEEVPLSKQLELIYQYGDPQRSHAGPNGEEEVWNYYTYGKRFHFTNGTFTGESSFPPMGRWTRL